VSKKYTSVSLQKILQNSVSSVVYGDVQCSAKCGSGTQQRDVFCGYASGNDVFSTSDNECDDRHRPTAEQNCTVEQCSGVWLAGPFGKVASYLQLVFCSVTYFLSIVIQTSYAQRRFYQGPIPPCTGLDFTLHTHPSLYLVK